jgi:hypothetical protein
MATKVQHFCDHCGAESPHALYRCSLRADNPEGAGEIHISRPQDLCTLCIESVKEALAAWGHPSAWYAKDQQKGAA